VNWRNVFTILRKELLDTLRDKRALVLMIGVPVVLYPALVIVGSQATIMQMDKMRTTPSRVALATPDALVESWLDDVPLVILNTPEDARAALETNQIDAVVAPDTAFGADLEQGRSAHIEILFDATEPSSQVARERLHDVLTKHSRELLQVRLAQRDIDEAYVRPLDINSSNVAPPAKATGAILGLALPILLVMMLALGAFYPAIDLTAGEKERGTFESLLTAPVSKLEIVFGKYFTVCLLSVTTGMLNLVSMGLTFGFQLSQVLGATGETAIELPLEKILLVLLIIVPLALFISAVMMSFAMFARTMKEAEFYLTPFLFVIMFPAMVAAVPGFKLTAVTQFIPITNVALLFKELMVEAKGWEAVFPVFISTAIYAMLALLGAVWVFQREEVVLSEEKGIPLTFRRARFRPRSAPTPGMALGLFGLALLLLFYVGSYAQQRELWSGMLITQWLLFALPVVLVLWYVRVDLRNALYLYLPAPGAYAATLIIGAGWLVIIVQLGFWQQKVLPVPEEMALLMEEILGGGSQAVWVTLLVLALSPAICEELLFRGGILSGLRQVLPVWAAIVAVGILFGLMHISIYRIAGTALSGMVLTYLVIRSGSILTSMTAHFMINAAAVLVVSEVLPEWLERRLNLGELEHQGVPIGIFAAALVVFAAGIVLMELTTRRKPAR
jgi:sodium transport system permease protein